MAGPLTPGPPARPADAARVRERLELLRSELPRARQAATTWRNGVAALMLGILGFGLVRGRSDVALLAAPWNTVAGLLLLLALIAGIGAAFLLLRAGNGRTVPVPMTYLTSGPAADHALAMDALRDLRRGLAFGLVSLALLISAVGTTWYGPEVKGPYIFVDTETGTLCGPSATFSVDAVIIQTDQGAKVTPLASVRAVRSVVRCP